MREHRNTATTNVVLAAILLFSFITTSMGIRGVWQILAS
jgi:hypothetical protein